MAVKALIPDNQGEESMNTRTKVKQEPAVIFDYHREVSAMLTAMIHKGAWLSTQVDGMRVRDGVYTYYIAGPASGYNGHLMSERTDPFGRLLERRVFTEIGQWRSVE
jgi:hypothetical protein